jgi:hypothetical protein
LTAREKNANEIPDVNPSIPRDWKWIPGVSRHDRAQSDDYFELALIRLRDCVCHEAFSYIVLSHGAMRYYGQVADVNWSPGRRPHFTPPDPETIHIFGFGSWSDRTFDGDNYFFLQLSPLLLLTSNTRERITVSNERASVEVWLRALHLNSKRSISSVLGLGRIGHSMVITISSFNPPGRHHSSESLFQTSGHQLKSGSEQ